MAEDIFVTQHSQCFTSEECKSLDRMFPIRVNATPWNPGVVTLECITPCKMKISSYH